MGGPYFLRFEPLRKFSERKLSEQVVKGKLFAVKHMNGTFETFMVMPDDCCMAVESYGYNSSGRMWVSFKADAGPEKIDELGLEGEKVYRVYLDMHTL